VIYLWKYQERMLPRKEATYICASKESEAKKPTYTLKIIPEHKHVPSFCWKLNNPTRGAE
jgi:hypothetical protein